MKMHKRRMEILSFHDSTGIIAHLEAMAQKGWALEKISSSIWHYKRIAPKNLRYAVVYLPSSSEFDAGPTADSQELQEFCSRAGWVPAGNLAQMHIFCNDDPNAIPIDTDPELQVAVIHRAMKKNYLPSQITMLILGMVQILLCILRLTGNPITFLSSNANLVGLMCWMLIIAMSAVDLTQYFTWRKKALLAAREGVFLPTTGSQKFQKFCLFMVLGGMLLWLVNMGDVREATIVAVSFFFAGLMFAAVFGVKALLKKRGAARCTTRAAVWITAFVMAFVFTGGVTFFAITMINENWFAPDVETYEWNGRTFERHTDPIPLRIEDLTDAGDYLYSTQLIRSSSIFLTRISATEDAVMGADPQVMLGYNIYDVHFPPLKALTKQAAVKGYDDPGDAFIPVDIHMEGVQVSRHYRWGEAWNTLLICFDSRYILLHPGWEMTEDQIRTAARILAP